MDSNFRYNVHVPKMSGKLIMLLFGVVVVAAIIAATLLAPAPADAQEGGDHPTGTPQECGIVQGGVRLTCVYDENAVLVEVFSQTFDGGDQFPQVAMVNPHATPDALAVAGLPGDPALLPIEMHEDKSGYSQRVRSELERLAPERVVFLGGPAVVDDDALLQAAHIVGERTPNGSLRIHRSYGKDRIGTMLDASVDHNQPFNYPSGK